MDADLEDFNPQMRRSLLKNQDYMHTQTRDREAFYAEYGSDAEYKDPIMVINKLKGDDNG